MPVDFEELEGSPKISLSRKELIGVRSFKINWADWPAFVGAIWGYWLVIGDSVSYVQTSNFYGLPGLSPERSSRSSRSSRKAHCLRSSAWPAFKPIMLTPG